MSENRRIKRRYNILRRKGRVRTEHLDTTYLDNQGTEHKHKWSAKISSFLKVFVGCCVNGFPIVVPKFHYIAWAFYPVFLVRKDVTKDVIPTLNHERIHVRQQFDIHVTISLPLLILCMLLEVFGTFNPFYLLCCVPFIPTIIYGLEMIRTYFDICREYKKGCFLEPTFENVRANTCFEREANMKALNTDYLKERKFWAVLAYTGIKKFRNYGI